MSKPSLADHDWAKIPNSNKIDLSNDNSRNMQLMRELLNQTGSGFCLAKWTQVSMHLGTGMTHSCHHPTPHKIPLAEIAENPSALHNTEHKKTARKQMLNGERPSECDYCWRIEDGSTEFSDRTSKSLNPFSFGDHDAIAHSTGNEDVYPRYMEISWNNACNFKCAYCGPNFSSRWAEEIATQGPYDLPHHGGYNWTDDPQYLEREQNPYIDAFWQWFPEASTHLHTLRITGGEPLMSKHTFKLMESLLENPNPELELAINSNGCPPDKLWQRFIDLVNQLIDGKCIKKFILYTSAEAWGTASEYLRHGMDFDLWKRNIEQFLRDTRETKVTVMSAFNVLSMSSFRSLLEYVLSLKKQYNHNGMFAYLESSGMDVNTQLIRPAMTADFDQTALVSFSARSSAAEWSTRVGIDIPYVRQPDFLDPKAATLELLNQCLMPAVDFMFRNLSNPDWNCNTGFEVWEASKLKRIFTSTLHYANNPTNPQYPPKLRDRLWCFAQEHDRRRGTDINAAFADAAMQQFFAQCESDHQMLSQGV